ncbi:hypothetical protein F441_19610 [Phytophthora nicotianae CJ01A1]|uniref:Uncharacterized protein n=6 Tax=Phytophthora nicotianae TaxID=4792 RepID=W2PLV2_PHYN3|nr:hypothetical protein PPTG_17320 [Phytophthora nicotianae INRA-310]ETI33578.1 hypothetical protein F443_19776 [Phytophthora nicotianae P1569]ETL27339.1 hypothetical protein L916_19102 [Phytophthora nicotianae]ETO62343.1 hypothetical protein F444_19737 [Phytophthora nicotianae P1976]ETP03434.1 hypothetical protein F441_19610 [Phytophthora nicotianae CJ01A1]ETP31618.1 hypothetical protein F442_19556 [Phytophthora nicotianae P10297]
MWPGWSGWLELSSRIGAGHASTICDERRRLRGFRLAFLGTGLCYASGQLVVVLGSELVLSRRYDDQRTASSTRCYGVLHTSITHAEIPAKRMHHHCLCAFASCLTHGGIFGWNVLQ